MFVDTQIARACDKKESIFKLVRVQYRRHTVECFIKDLWQSTGTWLLGITTTKAIYPPRSHTLKSLKHGKISTIDFQMYQNIH